MFLLKRIQKVYTEKLIGVIISKLDSIILSCVYNDSNLF